MRLALLVPALSLTIICHAQTANKPIPGTKYSIAPPPNFTLANQFSGFQNRELNASIMFTELPADFHTIVQSFSADALAAKGMTLIDRQNVTTNDLNGVLIKVTQSNSGTVYLKNILLFGDSKKCVLVNGIYPEAKSNLEPEIRTALLSTRYNENQSDHPLDAVNYGIDATGTLFQFTKFIAGSLLYTVDGEVPTENPTFVVASSIKSVNVADEKQFCIERFKQLPHSKKATIEEVKEIAIDNLHGYEIIAAGQNKVGEPQLTYQAILFTTSGEYYIMVGNSTEEKKSSIETYRKLAGTFKRKPLAQP